jgi:dipeptidyl aminopeptidase/acylaminoacyl peptidase
VNIAPYGSWGSPISSELITQGTVRLGDIVVDGNDIYWLESRPSEGGRYAIVRWSHDGTTTDVLPEPYNARTRVHEYGGGAFTVVNGVIYFANYADQRVYRASTGEIPVPITPEADLRYADFTLDESRSHLVAVREDHTAGDQNPVNTIVAISLSGESVQDGGEVLVEGHDFYAYPRVSPDGQQLCWIAWNQPNMPWDGTELFVADIEPDGAITNTHVVAGSETESIFQPSWSPSGQLVFVSEQTGWWNLYLQDGEKVVALRSEEAEYGLPLWVFGMSTYAFPEPNALFCISTKNGQWQLGRIDLATLEYQQIKLPSTEFSGLVAGENFIVFEAGSPVESPAIVRLDTTSHRLDILRFSSNMAIERGYISVPGAVEFATEDGQSAYGFFYPPQNKDFLAPEGELPPLIVLSHGGPTGATTTALRLSIQYWTSRGFAVLDVNYGGSTGYGREYRERLKGKWGIVDVDDCVNGAKHLIEEGLADPDRVTIRGSSASGFTTLAALAFRDLFKAGSSHYGVSDLEAMAKDTHKFEARYLDGLLGPYPDQRTIYIERSPVHHVDRLSCPLILFQGLEDKIVPPNQAEMMYEAVKAKGLPVALILFEGEQHGFRKAENIKRVLDSELSFFGQIFGFTPADEIEPIAIENL